MNPESYIIAKERLCTSNCSLNKLKELKELFKDGINSTRRFRNIRSVADLLNILEKRDLLSCENPVPLSNIAMILNNVNIIRNAPEVAEPNRRVLNFNPNTVTEQIHDLISSEIGKKWKDLARALNIKEGEIDNLEQLHPTIPLRVKEILLYYEKYNSDGTWFGLLNALIVSRRKDLHNRVQIILSR